MCFNNKLYSMNIVVILQFFDYKIRYMTVFIPILADRSSFVRPYSFSRKFLKYRNTYFSIPVYTTKRNKKI